MRIYTIILLTLSAILALVCRAPAETFEPIRSKIEQRVLAIKTLRVTENDYRLIAGHIQASTIKWLGSRQPDGTILFRQERTTRVLRESDPEPPDKLFKYDTYLSIYDGQFLYTIQPLEGETVCFKAKPEPRLLITRLHPCQGPIFDQSESDVQVLPDEQINERPVWVIEAVDKNLASSQADECVRVLAYIDQKTGLFLKTIEYDKAGQTIGMTDVFGMLCNEEIPADSFTGAPPPGVRVIELAKATSRPVSSHPATIPATRPR